MRGSTVRMNLASIIYMYVLTLYWAIVLIFQSDRCIIHVLCTVELLNYFVYSSDVYQ